VKLLQRTGHLTDFVLRLNSLVTRIQSLFLENCLDFSVDVIMEEPNKPEKNRGGKKFVFSSFTQNMRGTCETKSHYYQLSVTLV